MRWANKRGIAVVITFRHIKILRHPENLEPIILKSMEPILLTEPLTVSNNEFQYSLLFSTMIKLNITDYICKSAVLNPVWYY